MRSEEPLVPEFPNELLGFESGSYKVLNQGRRPGELHEHNPENLARIWFGRLLWYKWDLQSRT